MLNMMQVVVAIQYLGNYFRSPVWTRIAWTSQYVPLVHLEQYLFHAFLKSKLPLNLFLSKFITSTILILADTLSTVKRLVVDFLYIKSTIERFFKKIT